MRTITEKNIRKLVIINDLRNKKVSFTNIGREVDLTRQRVHNLYHEWIMNPDNFEKIKHKYKNYEEELLGLK